MKRIDLHVHTLASEKKDSSFDFNIEKLQEYIDTISIDIIAVTNHNLFDIKQFKEIEKAIKNIIIFPGIEIDFENCHLLLIGEKDNLDDFSNKCELIKKEFDSGNIITVDKLKEIFVDLDKYLLIPHYDKRPKIKQEIIDSLKSDIFVGEVQSPKKFNRIIKENNSLTPVLFSDARISTDFDISKSQGKQTLIKTSSSSLSINTIKTVLRDKNKVFLSNTGKHGFFQVFNNGQELSNGLNVVIGGRSSGKTFFLDNLEKIFNTEDKSIKYIKQFDLVKEDEKKFNEILENEKSIAREKYLDEFRSVVENIISIDRADTDYKLEKYIESLLEFATNEKLHDEFSRATLFSETPFQIRIDQSLKEIINAVEILLNNKNYKNIINQYILESNLNNLITDLKNQFIIETKETLKKKWLNDLIDNISQKLKSKTASSNIKYNDIDFYVIKMERKSVKKFNAIANVLKVQRIIDENVHFDKFKIQAIAGKYDSAGEMHDESHKQIKFSDVFKKYSSNSPIVFLEEIKKITGLEKSELYKYFCRVNYQVLNKYGKKVSGGERAEFNLLKALHDARQYEMLLIDEPESSFDNVFLKENVNKEIKEISQELPVIVVTHNNTVGISMYPDYILYTERKIVSGRDKYNIFSGAIGDKEFKTPDKKDKIDSYNILMDSLEAGEETYNSRKDLYNNFKK